MKTSVPFLILIPLFVLFVVSCAGIEFVTVTPTTNIVPTNTVGSANSLPTIANTSTVESVGSANTLPTVVGTYENLPLVTGKTVGNVNARSCGSMTCGVVIVLPPGTTVSGYLTDNGWVFTQYGFIWSGCITGDVCR